MKVLFLSAILPYPLISGGHVRIFNILKAIGKIHEVTLIAFIRSSEEEKYISQLEPLCKEVRVFYRGRVWQPKYIARALTSSLPLLLASYEHRALSDALTEEYIGTFDVVHCEPFYVAHVLPKRRSCRLVVAEHNIEYEVYGTLAAKYRAVPVVSSLMQWDVAKMKLWEERIWRTSDHIVCVSDTDRQVIEQVAPGKVTVVPNGVDCSYFQFRARAIDPVRPKFLFVGNYRWFPNTEAVRMLLTRVWPQVRAAYPNAMLTVAGSHMTRDLKNLGEKQGARMRGWAEDIRTVYMDAHVFLAPLGIAGGSKFKILEAMACGCPVITTREGMTGLAVRDGEHVLKAQTPEDFTRSIRKLMEDSTNRTRLVHAARSLVERTYGWERIAAVLDEVWRNV